MNRITWPCFMVALTVVVCLWRTSGQRIKHLGPHKPGRSLQQAGVDEDVSMLDVPDVENLEEDLGRGSPVAPGQYPFLASIRGPQGIRIGNLDAYNKHLCIGVLINPKVVLSSAHCVAAPVMKDAHVNLNRYIREGEDETPFVRLDVKEVKIHPSYNVQTNFNFDFALLSLKKSSTIKPIPLPLEEGCSAGLNCSNTIVLGWGLSRNIRHEELRDPLKSFRTTLVSRDECRALYGTDSFGTELVTDSMLCAGKTSSESCIVESGGPLLVDGQLKGLLSWGASCGSGKPDVFSNIAFVLDWIKAELETMDNDGNFEGRSEVIESIPREDLKRRCIFANGRWLPMNCKG